MAARLTDGGIELKERGYLGIVEDTAENSHVVYKAHEIFAISSPILKSADAQRGVTIESICSQSVGVGKRAVEVELCGAV